MWRSLVVITTLAAGMFCWETTDGRPFKKGGRPMVSGTKETSEGHPEPKPDPGKLAGNSSDEADDYLKTRRSEPIDYRKTGRPRVSDSPETGGRHQGTEPDPDGLAGTSCDEADHYLKYGRPFKKDGRPLVSGFGETGDGRPVPKSDPGRFAGTWCGEAVDYPEDGTSTDPLSVKLTLSKDRRLEGVASDRFTGGGETWLEEIYAIGDRIEFKVRHRTGINIRVTLGLRNGKLKGEGIPIRSDGDRCHIVLARAGKADAQDRRPTSRDSAAAASFDGRWMGTVKNRHGERDDRHSIVIDVTVDPEEGTMQITSMGDYQQAYDEHIDDAEIRDRRLTFDLIDRWGELLAISLWSLPGEKDRLWGEAAPKNARTTPRDIELRRAERREFYNWGGHRRLKPAPTRPRPEPPRLRPAPTRSRVVDELLGESTGESAPQRR